ncbi:MAG: hypothetical protein ACI837_003538 [Crocinitomicaceae bacterium]|jgi:hypothetical protein
MEKEKDIFDHLKVRKIEVPDAAYFENLTKMVIDKQRPKIIPMYKRPMAWIGAAAAVAIVALLVTNISESPIESSDPLLALNEFSADDLMSYVDDHIDEFDTEMISDMIPSSDLESSDIFDEIEAPIVEPVKQVKAPISLDKIDDQDILDYFDDEGIDLEDFEDDDSFI